MAVIHDPIAGDFPQIRAINTYILNTVLTFMQSDTPSPSSTLTKYNDIKEHSLPYLVAVDEEFKGRDGSELVLRMPIFRLTDATCSHMHRPWSSLLS